jgi:hypothetical protein
MVLGGLEEGGERPDQVDDLGLDLAVEGHRPVRDQPDAVPMHEDTKVVSWKSAATDASTRPEGTRTATTDDEFRALKATWDRIQRQRDEDAHRNRKLERTIAEINAEAAKAEKPNRPIKVKTFRV